MTEKQMNMMQIYNTAHISRRRQQRVGEHGNAEKDESRVKRIERGNVPKVDRQQCRGRLRRLILVLLADGERAILGRRTIATRRICSHLDVELRRVGVHGEQAQHANHIDLRYQHVAERVERIDHGARECAGVERLVQAVVAREPGHDERLEADEPWGVRRDLGEGLKRRGGVERRGEREETWTWCARLRIVFVLVRAHTVFFLSFSRTG